MAEGIELIRDGTYVCIEGPQFSTLAESLTYKNLSYSVIGGGEGTASQRNRLPEYRYS